MSSCVARIHKVWSFFLFNYFHAPHFPSTVFLLSPSCLVVPGQCSKSPRLLLADGLSSSEAPVPLYEQPKSYSLSLISVCTPFRKTCNHYKLLPWHRFLHATHLVTPTDPFSSFQFYFSLLISFFSVPSRSVPPSSFVPRLRLIPPKGPFRIGLGD